MLSLFINFFLRKHFPREKEFWDRRMPAQRNPFPLASTPLLREMEGVNYRLPYIPWQRCQFHLQQYAQAYVPRLDQRAAVAEAVKSGSQKTPAKDVVVQNRVFGSALLPIQQMGLETIDLRLTYTL